MLPLTDEFSSTLATNKTGLLVSKLSCLTTAEVSLEKFTSLILAKNWFPKPSPWLAPFTKPAMSTKST